MPQVVERIYVARASVTRVGRIRYKIQEPWSDTCSEGFWGCKSRLDRVIRCKVLISSRLCNFRPISCWILHRSLWSSRHENGARRGVKQTSSSVENAPALSTITSIKHRQKTKKTNSGMGKETFYKSTDINLL